MSKGKTSALDAIKQKVRQSGGASAQAAIIDTNIIEDDRKEIKPIEQQELPVDVHVNVHVDEKPKKKKFEELYARATLWVKREHMQTIEDLCRGERGEKTRIINEALDEYFSKRTR